MTKINWIFILILFVFFNCQNQVAKQKPDTTIEGWNILTNNDSIAVEVIDQAAGQGINHLQLSHHIVMDLRDVKEPQVAEKVNNLTRLAHQKGIEEVTIWDHSLYGLDYYPARFKTGPEGRINLDNPEFWQWVKADVRQSLDIVPEIDGIILTFIETGAHVEDQYSAEMKTEEEKLASLVDKMASVIIDERGLNLYIRTFIYTRSELNSLLKAVNRVKNPKVRVMTKETPHDFFLTHPVSKFVKDIESPTLIEFDACHEYNGQGIIASIFPETHLKRWRYYNSLPNVIGYVARTDRTQTSTIINTPSEINLFALHKAVEKGAEVNIKEIYDEFITSNYGSQCIPYLKPAFKKAPEIILSTLYTLGLPLNSHSRLDIENDSGYQRHVSGKWRENMNITLNRGIDTTLHYWKNIVNHLAPAWYKGPKSNQLATESQWVLASGWLEPDEKMNVDYLKLIVKEKEFGVNSAKEALQLVKEAEALAIDSKMYEYTLQVFERTYLTARLYHAVASAYFAYRTMARGEEYRTDFVRATFEQGLEKMPGIIEEILDYPHPGPVGQYSWREDAFRAMRYYLELHNLMEKGKFVYTPDTFKRFPYSGVAERQKEKLAREYNSLFEKNNPVYQIDY